MNAREQGFLIGLIEGEGYIGLSGKQRTPILDIVNTDLDLINFARVILEVDGIKTGCYRVRHSVWKPHWKTRYDLRVRGIENFKKLLPILQTLVSQHRRSQLEVIVKRIEESDAYWKRVEERQEEVMAAIQKGGTAVQIAVRLDVSPRYVYRWLERRELTLTKIRSGIV
ncbi:MAG: LAGLIDADG family homing endonuclease [Nitrososphaerales archaeon]